MAATEPTIGFPQPGRQPHKTEQPLIRHGGVIYSSAALVLFAFIVATFSLTAANTLRSAGIVLSLFFVLVTLKYRLMPAPEALLYAAWVAWTSMSYFGTQHTGPFVQSYRVVLQMTILLLSVSTLARYLATPTVALVAIVTGAVVSAGYALIIGNFESPIGHGDERVIGLLDNANGFGYQMLLALMAIAMLWGTIRNRRMRCLLLMIIPFFIAALISSGSRKNFVGLMLFIFLWIILPMRQKYRFKLHATLLSGIVLAGAIYLYDFVMKQTIVGRRFRQEFSELSSDEVHNFERIEYYTLGIKVIMDNPIIGIGLGNFRFMSSTGLDSHSDYIEVTASTGIPGAMIYFSIYIVLWHRMRRAERIVPSYGYLSKCSRASIMTILLVSLGMPQFSAPIHWSFVGILIGLAHHQLVANRVGTIKANLRAEAAL